MDLPTFLLARIAEDEADARAATRSPWIADLCRDDDDSDEITSWNVGGDVAQFGEGGYAYALVAECTDPHGPREELDGRPRPVGPWAAANAAHIARWDPAHVLAWCAAMRAVVKLHTHVGAFMSGWQEGDPVPVESGQFGCQICALDDGAIEPDGWCATVRALASPFAGHPDVDPSWR